MKKSLLALFLCLPSLVLGEPSQLFDGAAPKPVLSDEPAIPSFKAFPAPTPHPEVITLSQLADRLSKDPENVAALVDAILDLKFVGPEARAELTQAIQSLDKSFLDSFPTMSVNQLKLFIRLYAEKAGPIAPEAACPPQQELKLSGIPHDAPDGTFLTGWGRSLYHGDQTAHGLATAYADNETIASALNCLALNEPQGPPAYTLTAAGQTFSQVRPFLEFLLSTGHTVTAKDMRFFANFGGIWYRQGDRWVSVITPLFVKTGLTLPSGRELVVPVSHAHLQIDIRGPLVNADAIFYLGVGGTAMFGSLSTADKPWVGGKTAQAWEGKDAILRAERAATTRREIKKKVFSDAEHPLPLGGYGILGGCADVQAMIVEKPIYPLVRDPGQYRGGMAVDGWSAALPIDGASPPDPQRVYDSLAVDDPDQLQIPQSRQAIAELRELIKKMHEAQ